MSIVSYVLASVVSVTVLVLGSLSDVEYKCEVTLSPESSLKYKLTATDFIGDSVTSENPDDVRVCIFVDGVYPMTTMGSIVPVGLERDFPYSVDLSCGSPFRMSLHNQILIDLML